MRGAVHGWIAAIVLLAALPVDQVAPLSSLAQDTSGGLTPTQLAAAYRMDALHAAGVDGDGVAIGLVTWGPPSQDALDAYSEAFALPRVALEWRAPHANACTGEDHPEWDIDAQMAHAMAPHARILVYCAHAPRFADLLAALRLAVREDEADVLSLSWGTCEPAVVPETSDAFARAVADAAQQGIAVFVASGDGGSRECTRRAPDQLQLATSFPAVLPDAVAVGGTRLDLEPARHETVWNDCAPCPEMAWEASGGGASVRYAAPWWQPAGMRRVADVAAVADRDTGPAVRTLGAWTRAGGTSVAAPIWAGAWAALLEELGRQGNPAPLLWTLAADAHQDVAEGDNGDHAAVPGYDLPTGWGTLDGEALLAALEGTAPATRVTRSAPTWSATSLRSALLSQGEP